MLPCVEIYCLCYLSIKSPSFAPLFSASYRFHLFSLNVLFILKTLHGNSGNLTAVNNILTSKSMLSVIRGGRKTKGLVGYVKVNWKPTRQRQGLL